MTPNKARVALLLLIAAVLYASGVIPAIVPQAVPTANKQGNATKFQLSTGATVTNDCVKFDANGNTVDAGAACGGGTSFEFAGALCQNTTPSLGFSTPTANAPTPICKTGTNTQLGVAQFTATGQTAQVRLALPATWGGAGTSIAFRFISETAASTGNVVWNAQTACVANTAASIDPSFNAAQTVSVAAGANNQTNIATLSSFTVTGCSAGQILFLKLGLDGTTTAAGNEDLLSAQVTVQ